MAGYPVPDFTPISIPSFSHLRSLSNDPCESALPGRNVSAHEREQVLQLIRTLSGKDRDAAYQKAAEPRYLSNNTFVRFPQLSIELRLKIWKYVCDEHRIIDIVYSKPQAAWFASSACIDPFDERLLGNAQPLSLEFACKESHKVALGVMHKRFGIWINFDSDVLWLHSSVSEDRPYRSLFKDYYQDFLRGLHPCQDDIFDPDASGCEEDMCLKIQHVLVSAPTWHDETRRTLQYRMEDELVNLKKLTSLYVDESLRDSTLGGSAYLDERILTLVDLEDDVDNLSRQQFESQVGKEPMVRRLYDEKSELFGWKTMKRGAQSSFVR